jgi:hypothetical protein
MEKTKKALDPELEAVFKAQKDQIDLLQKANEDSIAALKIEKDKRELNEWIKKAEDGLSHYPGQSSTALGTMLKGLHDSDPELATKQFEMLKAASDAMKTSSVLKEAGRFGGDAEPSSAWAKVEKSASELVQKSADRAFTKEKAIDLVLERNPDLYAEYLNENPAQTGRRN